MAIFVLFVIFVAQTFLEHAKTLSPSLPHMSVSFVLAFKHCNLSSDEIYHLHFTRMQFYFNCCVRHIIRMGKIQFTVDQKNRFWFVHKHTMMCHCDSLMNWPMLFEFEKNKTGKRYWILRGHSSLYAITRVILLDFHSCAFFFTSFIRIYWILCDLNQLVFDLKLLGFFVELKNIIFIAWLCAVLLKTRHSILNLKKFAQQFQLLIG